MDFSKMELDTTNDYWNEERKIKKWDDIKSDYKCCDICMNEMTLIQSSNGYYWRCRVCNNTQY